MLGGLDSHKTWTKHADKLQAIAPLLTQEEEDLVKVLEHHVMWKGRYPIARSAEDYANNLVELEKLDHLPRERLEEVFDSLCKKLFKELNDRCKTYLQDRFGMPI